MLGPLVALLLLTSPAAGPVDQANCWLLCTSPAPTTSGPSLTEQWRQNDLDDRLRRVEGQLQQQRWDEMTRPVPPSTWTGGTGSSSCSLLCAAGFR